jgi:hypothetical protein
VPLPQHFGKCTYAGGFHESSLTPGCFGDADGEPSHLGISETIGKRRRIAAHAQALREVVCGTHGQDGHRQVVPDATFCQLDRDLPDGAVTARHDHYIGPIIKRLLPFVGLRSIRNIVTGTPELVDQLVTRVTFIPGGRVVEQYYAHPRIPLASCESRHELRIHYAHTACQR